ncbi:SMP-30/gluconolactonase/LRE family protein [Rhizobium sp. 18055]|uniref:SMP-30/gluconolactonase/LRE family protein n=1 Tax=Rhizobium sp. 18055 TaxID=2681403 RepID=UPI00190F0BD1|nr:SMP-30/gluconolactonase/LRE family protein [Rhizobium sp. 18055]
MGVNIEVALAAANVVGESVVWDDRRERLLWVDIVGRAIHALAPATGEHQRWPTPDMPTSIGLRQDGGAIVGLATTIALWDYGDAYRTVATVEPGTTSNRLNEGVVGPDGAFWIGTMENNIADDGTPMAMSGEKGRLYRYTPDGKVLPLTDDLFGITNTLVWLGDGTVLTADTIQNTIYSYEIAGSTLRNRVPVFAGFDRGLPDGSCLDEEGYIWNCRVARGGCIVRFDPTGRLDQVIDLPVSQPTSCTFGGNDLSRLFVTSARFAMTDEELRRNPLEGALLAIDTGKCGRRSNRFG